MDTGACDGENTVYANTTKAFVVGGNASTAHALRLGAVDRDILLSLYINLPCNLKRQILRH